MGHFGGGIIGRRLGYGCVAFCPYQITTRKTLTHQGTQLKTVLKRSSFFSERLVNEWHGLPTDVDFRTLTAFKRTVGSVDFSPDLKRY